MMIHELILTAQLAGSVLAQSHLTVEGTVDVSRHDVICLSERLAEAYHQARDDQDRARLMWFEGGCVPASRDYGKQALVRLTEYGAVVRFDRGRGSRERHVLFADNRG